MRQKKNTTKWRICSRKKALNDTVIKVKSNRLDYALKNTTDPKILQDIMTQQLKLKNIHIYL